MKILATLIILLSTQLFAAESMRRCALLPVQDSVGGAIGFKVYEEVERYLKESTWCYYRSNSEIMNILGNYKKSLSEHLENKDVLRVLAEKLKAGSLIRIRVGSLSKGANVGIEIVGDNGGDIYFKEETSLKNEDASLIAQTVKNWLEIYEKSIPYDARVLGVLGDQFTIDIGSTFGSRVGSDVSVYRMKNKKRHPLLKEVVDWEKEKIGKGKIFHSTEFQSQAKMTEYEGPKRLNSEDWVRLEKGAQSLGKEEEMKYPEVSENEFGKLGTLGFFLATSDTSNSILINGTNSKSMGGYLLGVGVDFELWITRSYFVSAEMQKKFGTIKKETGEFASDSSSTDTGMYKIKGGYRYLPLGFFYGPRIDGFLGYGKYSYNPTTSTADRLVPVSYSGLLLGTRGDMPIYKDFRLFLEIDFIFDPTYSEDVIAFGKSDSSSSYSIDVGVNYVYSPGTTIDGSLSFVGNKAKFENPAEEMGYKESTLKLGMTFTY